MNADLMLWLGTGIFATLLLLAMMRRRQLALIGLLKEHIQRQARWARRRAKAEKLAAQFDATGAQPAATDNG